MASRLPVIILTVFTILLLIEMCNSHPYHRDTDAGQGDCSNVPHVIVINSTTGAIINSCRKCPPCPYSGHGLNIPCHGQNVTESQNIECVKCVSGSNYSTGETSQCQPCVPVPMKCKAGERIVGKCEHDGDKRTCKSCELKHWYYNDTQMTCLPCTCENMTTEIKEICKEIGFNSDACGADGTTMTPNTTPKAPGSFEDDGEVWSKKYTILLVCVIAIAVLCAVCFLVCQRTKICCFKKATSGRPDTRTQNGNSTERTTFIRQISCPVTQNEIYVVINSPHAVTFTPDDEEGVKLLYRECKQQKLKFSHINAETCRKIYMELKDPGMVATGMGYTTLAGYMGFSAEKVKEFEATGDPCENMLRFWSKLNEKEHNVLKLKSLMEKLRRDDIVGLLNKELEKVKCGCPNCVAVKG